MNIGTESGQNSRMLGVPWVRVVKKKGVGCGVGMKKGGGAQLAAHAAG